MYFIAFMLELFRSAIDDMEDTFLDYLIPR